MSRVIICLLCAISALLAAISTHAQDKSNFDAREMFKNFCAPCHGVTGMGDGPVAEALRAQIKPLSSLAKRHGGTFPAEYIYRIIDGREEVAAHGTRLMPVWGDFFSGRFRGEGTAELSKEQIVFALVGHIKSLQEN